MTKTELRPNETTTRTLPSSHLSLPSLLPSPPTHTHIILHSPISIPVNLSSTSRLMTLLRLHSPPNIRLILVQPLLQQIKRLINDMFHRFIKNER